MKIKGWKKRRTSRAMWSLATNTHQPPQTSIQPFQAASQFSQPLNWHLQIPNKICSYAVPK